jgi:hypothetical protein
VMLGHVLARDDRLADVPVLHRPLRLCAAETSRTRGWSNRKKFRQP